MLSMELIRKDPDRVRNAVRRRGEELSIDCILALDRRRRLLIAEADDLRALRNKVSREMGRSKERPPEVIQHMRELGEKLKALEQEIRYAEEEVHTLLLDIPNIPRDNVPFGRNDSDNVVVRGEGELPSFSFKPLPHWELGKNLNIIDTQRGAKLSGSRFFVLKGKGSGLQRALLNWMMDLHTEEHGYQEVYLPYLVTRTSVTSSGHLPKFADTMYHDDEDDLWLIPTGEVSITNLYRDEILSCNMLPMHYVSHTPCFRREKAAAGRDTRGIKRVHQFEKVEMYKFVEPKNSDAELERLVSDAEDVCARLGIPYRLLHLATGDLGFSAVQTYDIEMWAPGSEEWLEVSSCSNCTDFQARRASIRYRPEPGARPQFVHTLNGSGLALPRVIIAILENFQEADGSIVIPEVLRPYTRFDRID